MACATAADSDDPLRTSRAVGPELGTAAQPANVAAMTITRKVEGTRAGAKQRRQATVKAAPEANGPQLASGGFCDRRVRCHPVHVRHAPPCATGGGREAGKRLLLSLVALGIHVVAPAGTALVRV